MIFQCTSEYPCPSDHINLLALCAYRNRYGLLVGLSDHSPGIIPGVAAATMGACYVEKHITLSRAMRGTDQAGSLEMEGLRRQVGYIRQVEMAMGDGDIGFKPWMNQAKTKLAKSLSCRRDLAPATAPGGGPGVALPWHGNLVDTTGTIGGKRGRCGTFPNKPFWIPRILLKANKAGCSIPTAAENRG